MSGKARKRGTGSADDQGFQWTPPREAAAFALAEGKTREEAAAAAEVTERTIYTWLQHPDFSAEVDRLTMMTGIAVRAERLRQAKRIVAQLEGKTTKDLLEWLKYAQSETDGITLDLAKLAAALGADASPLADS